MQEHAIIKNCVTNGKKCDRIPTVLNAWLAQLVEQRTENPRVSGSIPEPGTIKGCENSHILFFLNLFIFIISISLLSCELVKRI